ncbi:unnamed protein product [Bursaphelenchus okinawaensis]|uniref:Peptidase C1A papain C-terminal domain-containing protein n=1 Tax=Bursaphelenchus okinawaensis TaxID=465554 RepID=A0A811KUC0_9BILA|nr:unnamed protein product [Bursaphelenchus okinawaensis]CAG9112114.1 unnamed protein product [Bursaphelenchus okinawaensis]
MHPQTMIGEVKEMTGVKDQGRCGSCYVFFAVACIESMHAIRHGELRDLSVQQVISCTYNNPNHGCESGWSDKVIAYFMNHTIASWEDYPYTVYNKEPIPPCEEKPGVTKVDNLDQVAKNEETMKQTLFTNGPLVVYIDAEPLKMYQGGIIHSAFNNFTHAVTVVGYGTDTEDHWVVKNSWGTG